MKPSTRERVRVVDWRSWLALAWAAWFGFLYGEMILEQRAPWLLGAIRHLDPRR